MAKNQKVNLKFTLTDGSEQNVSFTVPAGADGADGKDGTNGTNGKDGVGIKSVTVTQSDVA